MTGTVRPPTEKPLHSDAWSKGGACAAVLCWTLLLLGISSGDELQRPAEPAYGAASPEALSAEAASLEAPLPEALAPPESIPSIENSLPGPPPQQPLGSSDPSWNVPASEVVRTSGSTAALMEAPDAGELRADLIATPQAP